jgi:dTDP-4-dehydrorhamnose reductase
MAGALKMESNPRYLVMGATGLLGQALMGELRRRKMTAAGLARQGADIKADITDDAGISALIAELAPGVVINTAALIDVGACEHDPDRAAGINGRAVGVIAKACRISGSKLVQVSTDHFYTGDGRAKHDEAAPVTLLNEYARSKHAGETRAGDNDDALIIRTNFTGWRGLPNAPTFLEWAVGAIRAGEEITAFEDFYTSTLDAESCARAIVDLAENGLSGLVNLGARDVASKKEFLYMLASALGGETSRIRTGSVLGLTPRRAESLGLDSNRAQALIDWELPDTATVIDRLLAAAPA